MNDSESSVNHLRAVVALSERMKEVGVAIYEHHYYSLVFGSWTIVAGRRKERVKITWDGRDGHLNYSEALFPDSSYSPKPDEWIQKKNEGIDLQEQATAYQKAERYLLQKYSV